jgi:hypothetical protein
MNHSSDRLKDDLVGVSCKTLFLYQIKLWFATNLKKSLGAPILRDIDNIDQFLGKSCDREGV